MARSHLWTSVGIVCVLFAGAAWAQQDQAAVSGSSNGASAVVAVPRLIKYSGEVRDARGEPLGSVAVRLTFAVYEEQQGGAALWAETQMLELDEQGHYSVLLGATRSDGLPVELFPAGKARWLSVQVEGRDEDPRVLLVSVPYALKAEDAAMLGGRRASDFVLAEQLKEEVKTQVEAQKPATTSSVEMLVSNPTVPQALTAATSSFTSSNTTQVVKVEQTGTGYGLYAEAPSNIALFGEVTGASGTTYGVKGVTPSTTGAGVAGFNTAATGTAYGILAQTSSTAGTALYGRATAGTGGTIGLWGDADSTSGTGIAGRATATSGATWGIYAEARSAAGTALVVDNTAGGQLVSAQVNGTEKLSVNGNGNVNTSGSVTATSFAGSGSALTALNASNLASGTVPSARISGTYSSALTFSNASNTFTGNGSGLTNLPAATPAELAAEASARAASDTTLQSNINTEASTRAAADGIHDSLISARVLKSGDTMTGTLNLPADGLVAGSNQLALSGGTIVGVGSSGSYWISGRPTLYIAGSVTPNLTLDQTSNGVARWTLFPAANNGDLLIYNSTGGTGTEKFRISTAGNVGIGISPLDKLHVYGDVRVGTGYTGCVKDADGTVIAGTCSSDRRLKTNIHPFPQLLDKLVRLTPVHFSWKSAEYPELHLGTSQSFGLIAQEVEEVFPELVTQDPQGWKAVKYNQLPFLMLQGIRELRAENDKLKEQMKSQQVQMTALKAELAEAKQILRLVQAQLLPAQRLVETAGASGPASPMAGGGSSR